MLEAENQFTVGWLVDIFSQSTGSMVFEMLVGETAKPLGDEQIEFGWNGVYTRTVADHLAALDAHISAAEQTLPADVVLLRRLHILRQARLLAEHEMQLKRTKPKVMDMADLERMFSKKPDH